MKIMAKNHYKKTQIVLMGFLIMFSSIGYSEGLLGRHSFKSFNYPDHFIRHFIFGGSIAQVGTQQIDKDNATFDVVKGLADPACHSFKAINSGLENHYLRHSLFIIKLDKNDGSQAFKADATFCAKEGLAGDGISFSSFNFPSYYIRHFLFGLRIDQGNDLGFHRDATFRIRPPLQTKSEKIIALVGDSHTDFFDDQPNTSSLPEFSTFKNFGVSGNTTVALNLRLPLFPADPKPDRVYLMIGVNDLQLNVFQETTTKITDRILKTAENLANKWPNTPIVIQSIFPLRESFRNDLNKPIREINQLIKQRLDNKELSPAINFSFLNLYPEFVTNDGIQLKGELTADGLHLNEQGYKVWGELLAKDLQTNL